MKLMPGPGGFGGQITTIVRIDGSLKTYASFDLNPIVGKAVQLGRVICQEYHAMAVEHLQHPRSNSVVSLVVVEAERQIGIHRVESVILHLIGSHFIGKAKPASFLGQIKDDTSAPLFQAFDG